MLIILKYFPDLTSEQIFRFEKMATLYRGWNRKINIISRKEIDLLYENHILHSLSIAKIISLSPGSKILDVGTGVGFPGIPLAILFPSCKFVLIDSMRKRIKVVQSILEALDLKNVTAMNVRVEDVFEKFDFVALRAVAAFPAFVGLVEKNISQNQQNSLPNGIVYLKGGNFPEEIKDFEQIIKISEIIKIFNEPFFDNKKVVYLPVRKMFMT